MIGTAGDKNSPAELTGVVDAGQFRLCANLHVARCNWLVPAGDPQRALPVVLADPDPAGRRRPARSPAFAEAEAAKRRLVVELIELEPADQRPDADPERGLTFDLLSSGSEQVITGHDDGVITLDLAEGDDVHREQLRISMDEPYRTLLGHFRHEIGHYFFFVLAETGPARAEFESLFGDPDLDYQDGARPALLAGRAGRVGSRTTCPPTPPCIPPRTGPRPSRTTCTSATRSTPQRLSASPRPAPPRPPAGRDAGFDRMIELWLPLAWSLNMINRSMGHQDLYPFVLPTRAGQDPVGARAGRGRRLRNRRPGNGCRFPDRKPTMVTRSVRYDGLIVPRPGWAAGREGGRCWPDSFRSPSRYRRGTRKQGCSHEFRGCRDRGGTTGSGG